MERPSGYLYGLGELFGLCVFSGLIMLEAHRTNPITFVSAAAVLTISIVSSIWSGYNIGRGKCYFVDLSIRLSALTLLAVLFHVAGFVPENLFWFALSAFSCALAVAFSVFERLRRQESIIEEWERSGKLNPGKRKVSLDVSVTALSPKGVNHFRLAKWAGALVIISFFVASWAHPESEMTLGRLFFLGYALFFAVRSSYPIAVAIILGRVEKRLGGPLLTKYHSG